MAQEGKVSYRFGSLQIVSGVADVGNTSFVQPDTRPSPVVIGTASATLTTAQVLAGISITTPASAATLTTPTSAALVAAFPTLQIGDSFTYRIINLSSSNTVTLAAGTGCTLVGAAAVAVSSSAGFFVQFNNVTPGSESVSIYRT